MSIDFLRGGARQPTEVMVSFIDANRAELGVAPVCKVLQIAPSTYYTANTRPESARAARDVVLTALILMLFEANYSVYGARKMWKAVRRKGEDVGRDQVARLMRQTGVCGMHAVVGRCSRHARTKERYEHQISSNATSPRPA